MAVKLISDRERFQQSFVIDGKGCWVWQKFLDPDGYGFFKVGSHIDGTRRQLRAHRYAYEEFVGPIPDGLQIDHLCRNRACVNPAHLEPVTGLVNTQRGWRANKTICKSGHPLSGDNLGVDPKSGKRFCRTCRRRWVQANYRKTNGAAQKKYDATHREERREKNRLYRANLTDEQRERRREYERVRSKRRQEQRRLAADSSSE